MDESHRRFRSLGRLFRQLRWLKRARLVQGPRVGQQRFCELNPEPLKSVDLWLSRYRVFWQSGLSNLKHFVEVAHAKEPSTRQIKAINKKYIGGGDVRTTAKA